MKICLIGNNLTNLVLANVLAKKKIIVDIIYTLNHNLSDSNRTIAISNDNFSYLKNNFQNFRIYAWPTEKIKIYVESNNSKELLEFKNKKKNIFYLIKYQEIFNSLLKIVRKNKYINLIKIQKHKYESFDCVNKYSLIINSDSKSFLSKKYLINKIDKNYNSTAYTTIINHKKVKNNIAKQFFTKNGPLAFLPLSNTQTSIVFSYSGKNKLDNNKLIEIIKKFNSKYEIKSNAKFENSVLKFSMLRKYTNKNILFFGDLIHKIHPVAGQGFNMTIRDIKILSDLIEEKIELGLDLDSSLADQFQKKTKHLNYIYGSSIDFIYEFFKFDNIMNNYLSNPIFNILKKQKYINRYATQIADKGLFI
tara:strand:+ start:678 stop:1766 length:1089 start_codon:yes stop_codon:yes gene_type:complete